MQVKLISTFFFFFFVCPINLQSTILIQKEIKEKNQLVYHPVEKIKIKGHFFSKSNVGVLEFKLFSKKTKQFLSTIPDINKDFYGYWNYIESKEVEIILSSSTATKSLYLEAGSGFYYIKNIGDNNQDNIDEIALVTKHPHQGAGNRLEIYQFWNLSWKKLFEFSINEDSFKNKRLQNEIPNIFVKRKLNWYYSDFNEMIENGKPNFKILKLQKCK